MAFRYLAPALLFAVTMIPKTAWATASAELYTIQPYLYGRFEARLRFAPGNGVVGSFFLWKNGSDVPGTFWNEVDFESLGVDCHVQSNVIFGLPAANHEQNPIPGLPNTLCTAYHDYRIEWTPTYIAWSFDGTEVRRETGATALAFSQNATAGMTFHFNIWQGDNTFGGTLNPAILPVRHLISWVQYSSFVNNAFQLQWREEFDCPTLPVGWAAGNWASPKGLSIHNPLNISFVNGIALLAMTADNAVGVPAIPPADPAGVLGACTVDAGTVVGAVDGAAGDASAGGTTGAGGAGASGATTGAGDASAGGTTGAGGAGASGATTGAGDGAAGGAATSGATGGAATHGAGGGQTGGNTGPGCSCRLAGPADSGPSSVWLGMLGLSLLRRRRDRTSAGPSDQQGSRG